MKDWGVLSALFFIFCSLSCRQNNEKKVIAPAHKAMVSPVVILQPLGNVSAASLNPTYNYLKKIVPLIRLNKAIELPASAYYAPRNRYRADSIINWLKRRAKPGEICLAITEKDISHTKDPYPDYGIMGLGFQPGPACVVSPYRGGKDQLYKVAIHELGHNMGLPHCRVKTCFMRDAQGKNPLREETGFCTNCRDYLLTKGWHF